MIDPARHRQLEELDQVELCVKIWTMARNELYLNMRYLDVSLSSLGFEADWGRGGIATDGFLIHYDPPFLLALYRQGRVLVDGVPAAAPEQKLDPALSQVLVDGEAAVLRKYTYVMMNKPAGVLSATEDVRQETVLDLLPPELRRQGLFPVGRLDKDSEGLLMLTNDGELAHRLLSPRHHVDKVYYIRTDAPLTEEDRAAFAGGILLADGTECLPAGLELLGDGREALVTLHEGKFHQIKRMTASRSAAVCRLKRLSMGTLVLDQTLRPGEFRPLTAEEVSKIGGKL